MGTGCFPRVRRLEREVAHSPPTSAEVKNAWSSISAPLYDLMAWTGISLPSPRTTKHNGSQNITKTLNIEKDRKLWYSLLYLPVNLSFYQANDGLLWHMRQWPLFHIQNYR